MNMGNFIDSEFESTANLDQVLRMADQSYGQGNLNAARELLSRAHALAPSVFSIASALGALDYQLGRYELAGKELSQAACLDPNHYGIHAQLAAVWLKLGDMPRFFQAVKTALRLNPADRETLNLLAKGHVAEGQYYEAARVCHRLLSLEGRDRESLMLLGKCFFELKELDMAKMTYERVLQLCPADALARQNLALIHRKSGTSLSAQADDLDGDIVVLAI
jgi:Flp pilus assembly protein TadD